MSSSKDPAALGPIVAEGWVDNVGVRLHFIQSNPSGATGKVPLVYIHGAYGKAEGFLPEMESLSPRRCVSISLRGRGKSDAPETGYSFNHHVSDIAALVDHLGLKQFCLMGWSMGVAYSVGYASQHPTVVAGMILLDYPARHPVFPNRWVDGVLSNPAFADWKPHAVRAIQRESNQVPLWNDLANIRCPVLVIGGGTAEALLKPEHIQMYRQQLPSAEIVVFADSGHNVSQPDYDRFIRTITVFLSKVDESHPDE